MTYKEFLQALADAYKATQDQIGDGEAFMCIVLNYNCLHEEYIVRQTCKIDWDRPSVVGYCNMLRNTIRIIEEKHDRTWCTWAECEYPEFDNIHQIRAHWLQLQADQA